MNKKLIAIVVVCVLLIGVVSLIAMELGGRKGSLAATANTLPVDALYHDWTITSDQTLRYARGSGDGEGDGRATYPPTAEPRSTTP